MAISSAARKLALAGGSTLVLALPAYAQSSGSPQWFASLEGGAACAAGGGTTTSVSPLGVYPGVSVTGGDSGCGSTGRLTFGQQGKGVFFGVGELWAVSWRETLAARATLHDNRVVNVPGYVDASYADGQQTQNRSVLDFEVGSDIGLGREMTLRLTRGLRYAHFRTSTQLSGVDTYRQIDPPSFGSYDLKADVKSTFDGIGPRLGLSGTLPLSSGFGLAFSGSGSVLWGRDSTNFNTVSGANTNGGVRSGSLSQSQTVTNIEADLALTFKPPSANNVELALGVRGESWIGLSEIAVNRTYNGPQANRLTEQLSSGGTIREWGPFARLTVKLGSP